MLSVLKTNGIPTLTLFDDLVYICENSLRMTVPIFHDSAFTLITSGVCVCVCVCVYARTHAHMYLHTLLIL